MATENRTATPDLQSESLRDQQLNCGSRHAAGSGRNRGIGNAPAGDAPALEDEKTIWEGRYSPRNFLGRTIGRRNSGDRLGGDCAGDLVLWIPRSRVVDCRGRRCRLTVLARYRFQVLQDSTQSLLSPHDRTAFLDDRPLPSPRRSGRTDSNQRSLRATKPDQCMARRRYGHPDFHPEQTLPKAHLLGIEEPQGVRDLIWHNSRLERDERTSEVAPV